MHSTDNLNDGYLGSGKRLWNSIKKHGKVNHSIEILEHYGSREDLKKREVELVNEDCIKDPMCMNLVLGGSGFAGDDHTYDCAKKGSNAAKLKLETDLVFKEQMRNLHSEQMTQHHKDGKIRYDTFTGKSHSEETKKIIREKKIGSGIGDTNSQYGTCWVTKDGLNKKIKKEHIEDHYNNGWVKGRILKNVR
jgi:hypothetical protein